jgi:Flp pilus assembly protein TadD/uncharacterized protein (AIM24 family)
MSAPARDEVEGLDEEFLYHLDRGARLLTKGVFDGAHAALARARELRPDDAQVLGLLGQSLYKLGRFDDAAEVYGLLVEESPDEAAARVNLGLASLKARRYVEAVRELEAALQLSPGHKKAMGYLGLAWLEQGDLARARSWFERAGSEQMIARCDERLAAASAVASAVAPVTPVAPVAPVAPAPEAAPRSEPPPLAAAPRLRRLGFGAVAAAPLAPDAAPFGLSGGLLTMSVTDGRGVLARAEGLLAVKGAVRLAPEVKRFRGRATEKPFGDGSRRMLRATGEGALLYARGEGRLLLDLELAGESAYFREEAVFAFEDAITFDNGRVTSKGGPDLNLVHLRGLGCLLLATRGDVMAVDVEPDAVVRVPLTALVGWSGAVTPRLAALAAAGGGDEAPGPGEPLAVEIVGEGRVLVDAGASPRR